MSESGQFMNSQKHKRRELYLDLDSNKNLSCVFIKFPFDFFFDLMRLVVILLIDVYRSQTHKTSRVSIQSKSV